MQSTSIIVHRKDGFFGVPIISHTASFAIKFDTGASNTIISIEKFTGDLADLQIASVRDLIMRKSSIKKEFHSASGHPFTAYPAYMENVVIGNCVFDKFYYYIVIERLYKDRKIALLGDDFIDCCGLVREPHGIIVISKFDFSSYHQTEDATISTDEILSVI